MELRSVCCLALFFLGRYDSGVVKDVNSVKSARKSIFKNHMIIFVDFVGAHLRVRPQVTYKCEARAHT